MPLNDEIVSGWLSGSDSFGGYDNPAGPLYIEGQSATEAALTDPHQINAVTITIRGATSCSFGRGCACC